MRALVWAVGIAFCIAFWIAFVWAVAKAVTWAST